MLPFWDPMSHFWTQDYYICTWPDSSFQHIRKLRDPKRSPIGQVSLEEIGWLDKLWRVFMSLSHHLSRTQNVIRLDLSLMSRWLKSNWPLSVNKTRNKKTKHTMYQHSRSFFHGPRTIRELISIHRRERKRIENLDFVTKGSDRDRRGLFSIVDEVWERTRKVTCT